MITRQELEGHWKQIVGQVREKWGQLTDDELEQAQGNTDQLVGVIQQKTGESRRAIEDFLHEAVENGRTVVERAKGVVHDYADRAREQYDFMADKVRDGYAEAEQMVQRRPAESVAVVFGVGLIAGLLASVLLRR